MDKKLLWIGGGILLLIGLAAVLSVIFASPPSFRGTSYAEPFPPALDFVLTQADGGEFRLYDLKGRIVLLFFGYTSCPDVCPTTLAEMKLLMNELGDAAERVQVVFISVDPDRDTPDKIQAYASNFYPTFLGLTGSQTELEPVWQGYSIFREEVQSDSAFGVIVNHTARLFLVDAQSNMRLSYAYGTPVADIAHDIELLFRLEP